MKTTVVDSDDRTFSQFLRDHQGRIVAKIIFQHYFFFRNGNIKFLQQCSTFFPIEIFVIGISMSHHFGEGYHRDIRAFFLQRQCLCIFFCFDAITVRNNYIAGFGCYTLLHLSATIFNHTMYKLFISIREARIHKSAVFKINSFYFLCNHQQIRNPRNLTALFIGGYDVSDLFIGNSLLIEIRQRMDTACQ